MRPREMGSLPRGKAEERMMQVMTREIPGSKYKVHRPSQLRISGHLLTGMANLQPDDKTSCDDSDVSEADRLAWTSHKHTSGLSHHLARAKRHLACSSIRASDHHHHASVRDRHLRQIHDRVHGPLHRENAHVPPRHH
jgi:hypothetical protein